MHNEPGRILWTCSILEKGIQFPALPPNSVRCAALLSAGTTRTMPYKLALFKEYTAYTNNIPVTVVTITGTIWISREASNHKDFLQSHQTKAASWWGALCSAGIWAASLDRHFHLRISAIRSFGPGRRVHSAIALSVGLGFSRHRAPPLVSVGACKVCITRQ